MITVGCMDSSRSFSAFDSSSPANITDDVVPSPTSLSGFWLLQRAFWRQGAVRQALENCGMSLVIVTSPILLTKDFIHAARSKGCFYSFSHNFGCLNVIFCASFPVVLPVPSFNTSIGTFPVGIAAMLNHPHF